MKHNFKEGDILNIEYNEKGSSTGGIGKHHIEKYIEQNPHTVTFVDGAGWCRLSGIPFIWHPTLLSQILPEWEV